MQLTPHPILLSLSGRLLQVTVAISLPAAKGVSKGRFSARIRSEGTRSQMWDFERWMKGELRWRSGKFYQAEGAADFRERVSRSIWLSKLRLSCNKFLPARGILLFASEVFSLLYVSAGWGRVFFGRESSPLFAFLNAAFAGGPSALGKTRKQRSAFGRT